MDVRSMLLECKNCGAPLEVKPSKPRARCRYCKATNRTEELRTLAPRTPPDWRPPRVWVPPAHMPAESVPLQYESAQTVIWIMFGVSTLGMVALIGGVVASSYYGAGTNMTWDTTTTLPCRGDQRMVF